MYRTLKSIVKTSKKRSSQVNIILLLDSLSNQFTLLYAKPFLAAHHLAFFVLVHLNIVKGIHNTVPT